MKIFRLGIQKKWHIVDPEDHNHSLCRENYNANPEVEDVREYKDEKLCNICMSRAYKRGFIGVYPKVYLDRVNVHKYHTYDSETVTRLYNPEKNYKETLYPDRNSKIADPEGYLTDQFFGFLIEELKGRDTGLWTFRELQEDLLSKDKHTKKQKKFWVDNFLTQNKVRTDLLYRIYPISNYVKHQLVESDKPRHVELLALRPDYKEDVEPVKDFVGYYIGEGVTNDLPTSLIDPFAIVDGKL